MTANVFARQREAIGLFGVCEDARLQEGETRGQEAWEVGINYATTGELLTRLQERLGNDHVLALGISCHGSDAPDSSFGGLAIEGRSGAWLRESNLATFRPFLATLGRRLERNGIVYFFGCRLGGTEPGRRLLMAISDMWRGRKVVGFVEEGHQHPQGQRRTGQNCELPGVQFGFGNVWGDWGIRGAVVALNGHIV